MYLIFIVTNESLRKTSGVPVVKMLTKFEISHIICLDNTTFVPVLIIKKTHCLVARVNYHEGI